MLRLGIISELGKEEYLGFARVYFDEVEMVSPWLPLPAVATRTAKHWQPIEVNSQVACLMDAGCEQGCIVAALWSDVDTAPAEWANENTIGIQFADGAQVYYDSSKSRMFINAPETDIEMTVKDIVLKGKVVDMTVDTLNVTGNVNIKGDMGMEGNIDMKGDMDINGKGHITGTFKSDTEVTAGKINLTTHKHPTPSGVSGLPTP